MWLDLFSFVCRLIGLAEWFEHWLQRREQEHKAKEVADAPITDDEENNYWRK